MNQCCIGSKDPNNSQAAAGDREVSDSSARAGFAEKQATLTCSSKANPDRARFSRNSSTMTTDDGDMASRGREDRTAITFE